MERGETGIIFEETMDQHKNLWETEHQERPERFTHALKRCQELNLISRCKRLQQRSATKEEIVNIHDEKLYNLMESTSDETDEVKLEEYSSNYDAVFVHPTTFKLAKISVGSTIELVKKVVSREVHNGMAIIRPPGHHAMKGAHNGYCFFNNVAIATQYALDNLGLKKILIVDWDVHHGQGTQRFFYNDPRVLFFSIHRFQHGSFWPYLRESDYDYVGEGDGLGFNFNVPLNEIGMKNEDYLAIFQQILLPVAVEYKPELIIVSCGFDAATGCPEGEMLLTPAFYSHMTHSLMNLADGKLAVVLEGGYCVESLAEGAALTLRTLLGDPCPPLVERLEKPSKSIQESILNCIHSHKQFWKCLNVQDTFSDDEFTENKEEFHKVEHVFKGDLTGYPTSPKYPTRNTYPIQSNDNKLWVKQRLRFLRENTELKAPKTLLSMVESQIKIKELSDRVSYVPSLRMLLEDISSSKSRGGVCHDSILNIYHGASKLFQNIAVIDFNSYESFENNPNTLYIQVNHSGDHLELLEKANAHFIHIPLSKPGDMEYVLVAQQIILPILYEFNPDMIILTSKFSSKVSAFAYGLIVDWISSLANGRIIINGSNGYHEKPVTECAKVLLGDVVESSNMSLSGVDLTSCFETIRKVNALHKNNWNCLQFNKKISRN